MASRTVKKTPLTFEQATGRLEEIIALMDNPETGLEDMIALVEEGTALIHSSRELLSRAELRIKTLENPDALPSAPKEDKHEPADDGFSLI